MNRVQETPLWAHIEVIVKETTPLGQFVLYYLNIFWEKEDHYNILGSRLRISLCWEQKCVLY